MASSRFSSRDESFVVLSTTYELSVLSTGAVYAESNELDLSTWCLNENFNWPYEQVECNILVQLKQSEDITIRVLNTDTETFLFKVCNWPIFPRIRPIVLFP